MATTGKKVCNTCGKSGGIFTCDGCEKSFCGHHTAAHRQELANQLDIVGQEHDLLRRDLTENTGKDLILDRINTWEAESINKIKLAADKARADLGQCYEQFETLCNEVSNEIRSSRESDSYSEIDLNQWMNKLQLIRNELENRTRIDIEQKRNADSIDLIQIYHNSTETNAVDSPERFNEIAGNAKLSQDNLKVTNTSIDDLNVLASISGAVLYTSGLYQISFEIINKTKDYLFFGIKSSIEQLITTAYCQPSTYGWWDMEYPVIKGRTCKHHQKNHIKNGDKIILTLDCDQGRISYIHERTRITEKIEVDENTCPLPWKFLIIMNSKEDSVRLLHYASL